MDRSRRNAMHMLLLFVKAAKEFFNQEFRFLSPSFYLLEKRGMQMSNAKAFEMRWETFRFTGWTCHWFDIGWYDHAIMLQDTSVITDCSLGTFMILVEKKREKEIYPKREREREKRAKSLLLFEKRESRDQIETVKKWLELLLYYFIFNILFFFLLSLSLSIQWNKIIFIFITPLNTRAFTQFGWENFSQINFNSFDNWVKKIRDLIKYTSWTR